MEDTHKVRSGEGAVELLCVLSLWNPGVSSSQHINMFTNQEAPPNLGPEFVLGFYYLGMIKSLAT